MKNIKELKGINVKNQSEMIVGEIMKKEIVKFDCKFQVDGIVYHLDYRDGEWRGTPGTDGKKLADIIIKFLKDNK
jgi:hypothetical protein